MWRRYSLNKQNKTQVKKNKNITISIKRNNKEKTFNQPLCLKNRKEKENGGTG